MRVLQYKYRPFHTGISYALWKGQIWHTAQAQSHSIWMNALYKQHNLCACISAGNAHRHYCGNHRHHEGGHCDTHTSIWTYLSISPQPFVVAAQIICAFWSTHLLSLSLFLFSDLIALCSRVNLAKAGYKHCVSSDCHQSLKHASTNEHCAGHQKWGLGWLKVLGESFTSWFASCVLCTWLLLLLWLHGVRWKMRFHWLVL